MARELAKPAAHAAHAAHACCQHKDSPKHDRRDNCPHCDGAANVAVAQKQSLTPPGLSVAIFPALQALPAPVSAVAADCGDTFACPFLPARTLLRLHCALLT
jgi:hypothetical protein